MKVLRINPVGNDIRHRRRELTLAAHGCEVGIVVPDKPYVAEWSRSEIEPQLRSWRASMRIRKSIPLHLWNMFDLRRAIEEFDPDVVDAHEDVSFPSAAQAVWAATGRTTLLHAAQNIGRRYPLPIRALRSWTFRHTAAVHALSTEAIEVTRRWGYTGICEVVTYGVEQELFAANAKGTKVGFVGRFVEEKGVMDLLPLGSRLLCVGDGPLAEPLRDAGAELRRTSTVSELKSALEEMAVLAMPSLTRPNWKEQFGRSAVEAMAAGIPVVAYDSGALREVVGDAGVVVREGDSKALLAAIDDVIAEGDPMRQRARQRAIDNFTWDAIAERLIALYGRALAQTR